MALYRVYAEMTVSVFTNVEAPTAHEAIEIARERGNGAAGDGNYAEEQWCCVGDLDGVPENPRAEEVEP